MRAGRPGFAAPGGHPCRGSGALPFLARPEVCEVALERLPLGLVSWIKSVHDGGRAGRAARARPGPGGTALTRRSSPEKEGSCGSRPPAPAGGGVRGLWGGPEAESGGGPGAGRGRALCRVPAAQARVALRPGARWLRRPHHGVGPRGVRTQWRPAPRLTGLPGRLGKPRPARAAVRFWPARALSGPCAGCSPGTWGLRPAARRFRTAGCRGPCAPCRQSERWPRGSGHPGRGEGPAGRRPRGAARWRGLGATFPRLPLQALTSAPASPPAAARPGAQDPSLRAPGQQRADGYVTRRVHRDCTIRCVPR